MTLYQLWGSLGHARFGRTIMTISIGLELKECMQWPLLADLNERKTCRRGLLHIGLFYNIRTSGSQNNEKIMVASHPQK